MKRVVLGCRSRAKAQAAKTELEAEANNSASFEILIIDLSNIESVKSAVSELTAPVDVLVTNAGGLGGENPGNRDGQGVTFIFSSNVLGHVALLDGLVSTKKLTTTAIFAGSETARGLPMMKYPIPKVEPGSVKEYKSVCDGSFFGDEKDTRAIYAYTKYLGALWMGSAARQYPLLRLVTISPGATFGTGAADHMPPVVQFLRSTVLFPILKMSGNAHGLEAGAKRYIDAIMDQDSFQTGHFYASEGQNKVSGSVVDQNTLLDDFDNEEYQDNANATIHSFL